MNLVSYALRRDPGGTGQGHNTDYVVGALSANRGQRFGVDEMAGGQIVVNALDRMDGGADDNSAQGGHLVASALKASDQGSHGMSAESAAGGHIVAGNVRSHVRPGSNDSGGVVTSALTAHYRKGTDSDATDGFVTHTLTPEGFDASEDGTGRGTPLATVGFGADPITGDGGVSEPIKTRNSGDAVSYDEAVRRLTPTECERLQGLPDGWTYPEGPSLAGAPSWYDLDPRERAAACPVDVPPDGPRYAACGDAVTAPVAQWIGERMRAVEEAS